MEILSVKRSSISPHVLGTAGMNIPHNFSQSSVTIVRIQRLLRGAVIVGAGHSSHRAVILMSALGHSICNSARRGWTRRSNRAPVRYSESARERNVVFRSRWQRPSPAWNASHHTWPTAVYFAMSSAGRWHVVYRLLRWAFPSRGDDHGVGIVELWERWRTAFPLFTLRAS